MHKFVQMGRMWRMTRGKFANRAEQTRHINEVHGEVEAGRRAIVKLTAENRDLRARLAEQSRISEDRIRHLTAQVREGTSAELEALRLELRAAREDRDRSARVATTAIALVADVDVERDIAKMAASSKELAQVAKEKGGAQAITNGIARRKLRQMHAEKIRRFLDDVGVPRDFLDADGVPAGDGS